MKNHISVQRISRHYSPVVEDLLTERLALGEGAQVRLKSKAEQKTQS